MIQVKRIFPECNADTLLVELILERGSPAHYKGITKVAEALERISNNSTFVIGIVDSDKFKKTPSYLTKFTEEVENVSNELGLIFKKMDNTNKHLVYVCPEFETWIWNRAIKSSINAADFGFNSLDDFYKVSKGNEIRENVNFKKFINAIVRSDDAAIEKLKSWLSQVVVE